MLLLRHKERINQTQKENKAMTQYYIYYKANTYNPHRSYPRNYDRYIRCRVSDTIEGVKQIIKEINAQGLNVKEIYNAVGKKVTKTFIN